MHGQNSAIFLRKRRAARAKPLQNLRTIARRAPRKFWQRRKSFAARSLRFWRDLGAHSAPAARFCTAKIARLSCKNDARRAPNHRKTCARSLGVRRTSFGSVGEALKRVRCAFGTRSAPENLRKSVFRRPKSRDLAAKPPRGARKTIAKRV